MSSIFRLNKCFIFGRSETKIAKIKVAEKRCLLSATELFVIFQSLGITHIVQGHFLS